MLMSGTPPIAELTLFIPNRQLEALESAASCRGMTTGQLLRRLIQSRLAGLNDALPPEMPALPGPQAERPNAGVSRDD